MQTVVETPTYLAVARKLFDEEEREEIVTTVAFDPECGEVMAGTGGFRKESACCASRHGKKGRGQSYLYLAQRQIPCLSHYGVCEKREGKSEQGRTQYIEETCRRYFQ